MPSFSYANLSAISKALYFAYGGFSGTSREVVCNPSFEIGRVTVREIFRRQITRALLRS